MLAALSANAQTAIIAAAASIVAATVTAVAATYSSRIRIREVRLTYEQKLHENYLASARAYTATIYLPLSIALTNLSTAFVGFRDGLAPDTREPDLGSIDIFTAEVKVFVLTIAELASRGADAFLTTDLEDEIISLKTFLERSIDATASVASVVLQYRFGLGGLSASANHEVTGYLARGAYRFSHFSVGLLSMRASYHVEKLLAAPLNSPEFERRMVEDLATIKTRIKEVTLGAHAGPS